jgi:glycosyltransferase involved in cell wall biosynthesis
MKIDFIIPVFNECETLEALTAGITEHVCEIPHRILFVDDGSDDGSFEILKDLSKRFPAIEIIRLRRNFGKTPALAAAFSRIDADIVIMMDADLQDDPKEIPRLLEKLGEGYDLVCGWKARRHDPWHKTFPSRFYNRVVCWAFGLELHDINTGFKAMRAEVAGRMPLYGEMHRMIAIFAAQLGYRVTEIPVEHHPRRHGRSKFGIERFGRGACDALTTHFLIRYSASPSHFFGKLGIVFFACGAAVQGIGLLLLLSWWLQALSPATAGAFMVVAMLFLGMGLLAEGLGVVVFAMGLLGELILHRLPLADPVEMITEEVLESDRS